MRVTFATILTAAAIATPAAAQYSFSPPALPELSPGTEHRVDPAAGNGSQGQAIKKPRSGAGAYAQAPAMRRQSLQSEWDVYVNGVYVGSDPDPRIRETLRREFFSESNSR